MDIYDDAQQVETYTPWPEKEEVRLQKELARYRDLFECAPVGYFLLNENGVIVEVNRVGSQQLGHALRSLTGRRFCVYLDDSSRTHFEVILRRAFTSDEVQRGELRLLRREGEAVNVQLDAVRCPAGQVSPCVRVTVTDISSLKLAQESISALNTTLEQRVEERTAQIRELNLELESFVQAVTHELQEPLRQATTLSEVLRSPEALTPQKAEQYSQVMLERVEYMNTLLDALNTYFRLGRQRARFVPVSLERVLADVKKQLRPQLQQANVIWHQEALPTVTGDSRSLQTIFHELLDNALKFSRTRGAIHLSILKRETETEYYIGVQDNGIGFNMRHREKVFGIFHRLHSGKEYAGLGLGLPLVRRSVLRHGGRCWAESEDGKGSTFWVALPKNLTVNF